MAHELRDPSGDSGLHLVGTSSLRHGDLPKQLRPLPFPDISNHFRSNLELRSPDSSCSQ